MTIKYPQQWRLHAAKTDEGLIARACEKRLQNLQDQGGRQQFTNGYPPKFDGWLVGFLGIPK